jgi:AcrR family transcriptional regulator
MASLREEQRRFTHQKLVDAARDVFSEKGFAAATIEDVVNAAGASRGTFYLYFKTKSDLVKEMLNGLDADARAALEGLPELSPDSDNSRVIRIWVEALINVYESHAVTIQCLYDAEAVDPSLRAILTNMVRLFSEKLEDGFTSLRRGTLGSATEEERFLAFALFLQFERLCSFWFTRGVPIDRELAVTTLTRLWTQALAPAADRPAPKAGGAPRRRRERPAEMFAPRRST